MLVQVFLVLKVMGNGLVSQFISQDNGLVLVTVGDALPDTAEQLLTLLALEEPGLAMSVVDIITRLSAWAVVHIQNKV